MKKILLVEDDDNIREAIEDYFIAKAEYRIITAADGDEGMSFIENDDFDMMLLDIMLPGIDGFSLCRAARRKCDTPIIFISARGREEDILYGYELGCDDYIVKPFSLPQFYAKVSALMKRASGNTTSVMSCGHISLNVRSFQVFVDEQEIHLPPKQYEILHYLLRNQGNVCTRDAMIIRLWGYEYEGEERVLDNHIKKLRKALGTAGYQIKTVVTKGYKLIA